MSHKEVLTRDLSSGRIHRRLEVAGRLIPYGGESDNLDDAGAYEVVTSVDGAEVGDLCERCFPPPTTPGDEPLTA